MSVISLLNVSVLNNPAKFTEKYSFEITFECIEALSKDLEFKLTYVGSATSSEHDQELDTLLVGPIPVGVNKFVFEADAPDLSKIPASEILGVTVLLLTCSYDGREFVRVGYYVNNEYDADELNAEPPAKVQTDRIVRNILAEKPRVTRFAIKWDSEESAPPEFPPDQPEADLAPDDEEQYAAEELVGDDEDEAGGDSGTVDADAMDEDVEMGGADEDTKDGDDIDEDGDDSEDLEAESEGSDDEEEDEDEGVDEDETMDTSSEHPVQQPAVPGAPGVATH